MDNMQLWLISSTDSINLNSGADGFYLNPDLDGLTGLPEIRSSNGVNGGYDGGWTSTQLWDARLITIRGLIVDKDGSVVEAKRKQLAKLVGQGKKDPLTLKFVSEAGHTYTCTVRTTNCTMALQNVYSRQEYQIQLRADDPLIYDDGGDDAQATLRVQADSEGFEIPFDIPLDISGGADPVVVDAGEDTNYPLITMYGELHSPTIVNQTTNQQLQLRADLNGLTRDWNEASTASGDYITLTNNTDYNAPILDFELDGNATQDGTPTPDAPVAVNTTTGENVVKITGKNLFDKNAITSGKLIDRNTGALNNNANYATSDFIPVKAGEQYAYTGFNYWYACGFNSAKEWTSLLPYTATITIPDGVAYIRAGLLLTNLDVAQLELGSTATDYEPYQGQEFEANLGKNLLNTEGAVPVSAANLTLTRGEDGSISWNGTAGNTFAFISSAITVSLEPNDYVFSIGNVADVQTTLRFTYTDNTTTDFTVNVGSTERSGTLTKPAKNVRIILTNMTNGADYSATIYPQLELGSQATSYSAYFTPYELAKIGNYQDRIYKDDGKWYIEKQVGKVVLDGTEDWVYVTTNRLRLELDGIAKQTADASAPPITASSAFIGSNYYSVINTVSDNIMSGSYHTTADYLFVYSTQFTSATAFKTWLSTHPTTVYYALATPTTTEITEQALIDQLEAIVNATLPTGENNIMLIPSMGAQGSMVLTYGTGYIETPPDVAVIDCKDRTVSINGVNAFNLLAEGSEFIRLEPGENKLYLASETQSDSGYAEVKFKTGNLSI